MLILTIFISSIASMVQSFSTSYTMFVICEFINAGVLCSAYPAAVLLCMEWSEPKHRVTTSSLAVMAYPVGLALTGLIASFTHHFRLIIRYISGSALLVVLLLLFSSESLRWMLVKGKQEHLEATIASAAKWNNLQVSSKTLEIVREKCRCVQQTINNQQQPNQISVFDLLRHKSLVFRFLVVSFCWISGTFIVFGVSVISVSLSGDKYMNFIIVGLGGVPASIIVIILLKHIGRRKCTSICLLVTSAAIISTTAIPKEHSGLALMTFLIGRCFSSVALSAVYIYTSELWPTSARHTMISLHSTLGRTGATLAPLTPLLVSWAYSFRPIS